MVSLAEGNPNDTECQGFGTQLKTPAYKTQFFVDSHPAKTLESLFRLKTIDHTISIVRYLYVFSSNTTGVSSNRYLQYTGSGSVLSNLVLVSECPALLTLFCVPRRCGEPMVLASADLIINGRDASAADWPWHVGLGSYGKLYCGGALIGPQHVITAAHCV